jgi:chemotaxis signal transduction protein
MKAEDLDSAARLAELRTSFDRTFAEPPAAARAAPLRLLAIQVGSRPLAVRLEQVSGIDKARRLLVLPGAPASLLGLMGMRGTLVPVFSLARIIGTEAPAAEPWVLFGGGRDAIGLACAAFDGHVEVAPADVIPVVAADPSRRYVNAQVRMRGVETGVLDLASVFEDITRAGQNDPRRSMER